MLKIFYEIHSLHIMLPFSITYLCSVHAINLYFTQYFRLCCWKWVNRHKYIARWCHVEQTAIRGRYLL